MDPRFTGRLDQSDSEPGLTTALLPVLHPRDSHAATLAETADGDLLCAWFNGPGEGEPGTNVVVSRLPRGEHSVWSAPDLIAADPERSEQNPVLFRAPDGQVWLLHTSNTPHDRTNAHVLARRSGDGGLTWSEPEVLFAGPGFFLRNPPVFLPDGTWLLPAYQVDAEGEYSVVALSEDQGRSWQVHEVPGSRHRVQMSVAPRPDGSLLAFFRSRASDRIYASESADLGRTWSEPVRTVLPNNNSAVQLLALQDGRLVVVFNDATLERDQFRFVRAGDGWRKKAVRTPLTLALSEDGGRTWPYQRNLQVADLEYKDAQAGYSYPTLLQTSDGVLNVAYSYLRKTIKHVRLSPDWITDGAGDELALDSTEDVTT